jgi:hypothetical protein
VHYMGKVSTHIFHMQTISTAFIFERWHYWQETCELWWYKDRIDAKVS